MHKSTLKALALSLIICLTACSNEPKETHYELKEFQTISLLGDSLKIPQRSEAALKALNDNLEQAKTNFGWGVDTPIYPITRRLLRSLLMASRNSPSLISFTAIEGTDTLA